MFRNIIFIFYLLFFLLANTISVFSQIKVKGNKKISSDTIIGYFSSKKDLTSLSAVELNDIQKKLFETGFFKNIQISKDNDIILVSIEENSLINFFNIEGIDNKSILSILEKNITNKENTFFSEYKLKQDIEIINSLLKNSGYFNSEISSSITLISDNRVNIFYNVKLNSLTRISRIFFIGDKVYKNSTLLNVVESEEHGWWKFFGNSSVLTANRIDYDVNLLKNFYLNNGYYDVQISSSSIDIFDKYKANLTYSINSGELYNFGAVNFLDSNALLKKIDLENLNKLSSKIINQNYSIDKIKFLRNSLSNYFENNFVNKINFRLITKKINKKLNIEVSISADINNVNINNIVIRGNTITEERVVRNQLLISEGDYLNKIKLSKSIDNLKSIKFFKEVNYETFFINNSLVDLVITVVEMPTGEVSAGAGYGTDGGVISTSIIEKNFLGKGISLNSNVSLGTENISGSISLSKPNENDSDLLESYRAFITKYDFENAGYENRIIGLNHSLRYDIYENISFSPKLEISHDKIDTSSGASALIKSREGDYITTLLSYSIFNDHRDKKFETTSGYLVRFGQDFATLVSDVPTISNKIGGTYYYKIAENFQSKINADFVSSHGLSNENIKLSDRHYIRSKNLRGFKNRGIGPIDGADHIGGNYGYNLNFSTTIPNGIPDKWNADTNIFFDVANLWGVDYSDELDDSNKIRTSAGVGLTWISPLGPLSITYAQPISKASTDKIEQFSFSIGTIF